MLAWEIDFIYVVNFEVMKHGLELNKLVYQSLWHGDKNLVNPVVI